MKADEIRDLSYVFQQASDQTRLEVLLRLDESDASAAQLGAATGRSQAGLNHHLALLRHGKLIEGNRDGQRVFYRLTARGRMLVELARHLAT